MYKIKNCLWLIYTVAACLTAQSAVASSSPFSSPSPASSSSRLSNIPSTINSIHNDNSKDKEPAFSLFQKEPQTQRKRWLRLPSKEFLAVLRSSKLTSSLVSAFQYGIIAYLAIEIFHAVKDVYQELQDDPDLSGNNNNALLSPVTAKKLIAWMEQPPDERGPPPNISPSWMIPLAHDLKSCHGVTYSELSRILSQLTKSQANLLQSCLLRPSKRISFSAIGGLSAVKESIEDWISSNCQTDFGPSTPYDNFVGHGRQGMVLWGPPGCGKSLLMQAIARKSGWPTLVVTPSLMQRKWYGESTNQVRSLFGLISTLGPCIVVLDELDGLFRVRSQEEHEVSRELKTEWLQWWDGVASSQMSGNGVLVIAATNRPWDVDPAVWRRLPQRYYVGVPTWDDRCDLLQRWTKAYELPKINPSVVESLAEFTEGYTPSDLFQILQSSCRKGPMARKDSELTMEDVEQVLHTIPPTRFSPQYIQQIQSFFAPQNHYHHQQHQQQQQHSQSQQQQQPGQMTYTTDDPQCWETPIGNFYHFNIPVDSQVFDVLQDFWSKQHEWESSDDEDESEEEDDAY
jgi:ATP-dependent 26S proteasome regulatory subunit